MLIRTSKYNPIAKYATSYWNFNPLLSYYNISTSKDRVTELEDENKKLRDLLLRQTETIENLNFTIEEHKEELKDLTSEGQSLKDQIESTELKIQILQENQSQLEIENQKLQLEKERLFKIEEIINTNRGDTYKVMAIRNEIHPEETINTEEFDFMEK